MAKINEKSLTKDFFLSNTYKTEKLSMINLQTILADPSHNSGKFKKFYKKETERWPKKRK
jgi:hypothetical protein